MPKKTKKKDGHKQKISELENQVAEEKRKSETYLTQLKYVKADLENIQKRTQKTIEESTSNANRRLILQLLPILDELELAVETARNTDANVIKGIEMIKGKLEKTLESEGLKKIIALGERFDPRYHEAVFEEETDKHPDGFVIDEILKGYLLKNQVLRASMVKVSKNPSLREKDEEN